MHGIADITKGWISMKLSDAITKYRGYRQTLEEQTKSLVAKRDEAGKKYEATGDSRFSDEAATLQLSVEKSSEAFNNNQKVLDGLIEQYAAAWNAEVAKAQADPENGIAATLSKIMTTVARMCAGDKVPFTDEKKVMEYNSEMYARAKQAQMTMAALKNKQKEYESLWDEESEKEYDPEGVADNTEACGDLPGASEIGILDSGTADSEILQGSEL